jgi:hypothetical protein
MIDRASLLGVHPQRNAVHVREGLDDLADRAEALARRVDAGLLRFARPGEREDCRAAVARLADVLLGLAQQLEAAA